MIKNSWPGWTEWKLLSNVFESELELENHDMPHAPGCYIVGSGCSISRARHRDVEGILTVGKASFLRQRIARFWHCANNPNSFGHMAGVRYRELGMSQRFPLERLRICWCNTGSEREAAMVEASLLREYRLYHLENPPLNYNAPNPISA